MSENLNTVQLMTIPAPLFKHGNFVEWFYCFGEKTYIYAGNVIWRIWCEDEPDTPGYWEYGLEAASVTIDGIQRRYITDDTVRETELRYANITREIDTITKTKRFSDSLIAVTV